MKNGKIDFARNEMYLLRNNDWSQLELESNIERSDIVNAIEDLGYDGFFNFEWDEDRPHANEQFSKASIGLFGDINEKLEFFGVQPLSQLKTPKFDKIHESDVDQMRSTLSELNRLASSREDYLQRALAHFEKHNRYYSTLSLKDVLEIADKYYSDSSLNTLTESAYEENRMRKAKEIGLEIPPERLIRI